MRNRIYLSSPHMSDDEREKKYIEEAFDLNWITSMGKNINMFEENLCKYTGAEHAVALSSGTAAIHMALKALGIEKGDLVICQSLTFSASANPILYLGATPIFIDSEKESWNMDPELLEIALKENPNVKAVIVVHLYGYPAQLDRIKEICNYYDVSLIEDAAESLGATYYGHQTGTVGDCGVFSFNGNKIITTSGGGMLVSENEALLQKVRFWSTQSRDKARHYQHSELGYNYRMSNVLAGIGRGQLEVLDKRIKKKKYINGFYKKAFEDISSIKFQPVLSGTEPNYWLTALLLDGKSPSCVIDVLEQNNVESRPLWKPMHLQPFFEKYSFYGTNISEQLFYKGICLPSDTKMTDSELNFVSDIIIKEIIYES